MDLLSIFRTFRRHWLLALPVILLTIACAFYALVLRPTDYEATASVALLAQPGAPRDESGDIVEQTEAGKTESPLSRFSDQRVVVDIVAKAISTDTYREQLQAQGADTRYEVTPGSSAPIADITAIATTPAGAVATAEMVAAAFVDELQQIQLSYGVDPAYMITTLPVEVPEGATRKFSSSMRLAIAIVALGAIGSFFVVSIAEARRQVKEERRQKAAAASGSDPGPDDDDASPTTATADAAPPKVASSPPPPRAEQRASTQPTPPPRPPARTAEGDASKDADDADDSDDSPSSGLPERKPWGANEARRPASMPTRPLRGR